MAELKKIVYISSDSNKTGGPVHLLHLINGLKDDFDIEVLSSPGWLTEQLDSIEIRTHLIPIGLKSYFQIRSILRKNKDAIVHCQGVKAGLVGRLAALGLGLVVVYTEHNWTKDYKLSQEWRKPIQLFTLKLLSKVTDKIICVSEAVKDFYTGNNLAKEDKLGVLYNGVQFFDFDKERSNEFVIGSIGSLVKRKGFEIILEAFSKLRAQSSKLKVVGKGELEGDLKQLAKELGILDKIEWLPADYDPKKFWSSIDLYVQASYDESFGMAIAEAIGNGIPTVASNVGAVPELISDSSLLFEAGDPFDLFGKIKKVYGNYEKYIEEFSVRKKTFREKFSVVRMVEEYRKFYNEL